MQSSQRLKKIHLYISDHQHTSATCVLSVNQELFLILVKLIHCDFHLDGSVEMSLAHQKLFEFSSLLGY